MEKIDAPEMTTWEINGYTCWVFNPHNTPVQELPTIFGFDNSPGPHDWHNAIAIAEDGTCVGGHCCSHESFVPGDLGCTPGWRLDRHRETYQKHYPDGYKMEFIPSAESKGHKGLDLAYERNQRKAEAAAGEKAA